MERDKKMVLGKGSIALVICMLLVPVLGQLFMVTSVSATGNTIYVKGSNTAGPWEGTIDYPFRTITQGVTAADPGDTVYVFSGTYYENIVLTKDVTLTGENKETTFIDGGAGGHVLNVHEPSDLEIHVSITKLTIRNAGGSGFDCMTLQYVADGVISDCTIINSNQGEGIQMVNCHGMTIQNSRIIGNYASGISLSVSDDNIISNNEIKDNQKGIFASFSDNNHISSNIISDNSVYGVCTAQSSGNVLSHNVFSNNLQNAQDASTNSWSENGEGNTWDDYNHYDNDSNGIGDVPYNIPGGQNQDQYPLGEFIVPEPPGGGNQAPTATSIWKSNTTAWYGDTISFSGAGSDSDGTIIGYHWRSSLSGSLSSLQSFSTNELVVGTHVIFFKVQDNDGAWSSEIQTIITITAGVNHAPVASIDTISPNPAKQGQTVFFQGHGSDQDGSDEIMAYKWISDRDGVIGTTASFTRSNLSRGTHLICFQVQDESEWSPQVNCTLIIQSNISGDTPDESVPVADVGGPYQGRVNEAVTFNGSGSYDTDGSLIAYLWSFGDNGAATGVSPTHTYTAPGTYTVSLQVTDNEGKSTTASTSIIISLAGSQQDGPGSGIDFLLELPFPVIISIVFLSVLGAIAGFILWMKKGS